MTDVAGTIRRKLQFQSPVVEARTFDQSFGPYDEFPGLKSTNEIIVFCISHLVASQQGYQCVLEIFRFLALSGIDYDDAGIAFTWLLTGDDNAYVSLGKFGPLRC